MIKSIDCLKPFPGFVLIKPHKSPVEEAGFHVSANEKERPQEGEVIAFGGTIIVENSDEKTMPYCPAQLGDMVVYKKWAGAEEIEVAGEDYIFIKFEDLISLIEEEK